MYNNNYQVYTPEIFQKCWPLLYLITPLAKTTLLNVVLHNLAFITKQIK